MVERTSVVVIDESKIRVDVKKNYKGQVAYEYTIKADTPRRLEKLLKEVKGVIDREVAQNG